MASAGLYVNPHCMASRSAYPLVEIERRLERFPRWGFVVAEGRSLIVLNQVNDSYRIDGYCVIRREDIASYSTRFKKRALIQAALRLKAQAPVLPEGLELGSMCAVMHSAQARFSVLVINREKIQPSEVEVGAIRMSSEGSYVLRWLSTLAKWEHDDRSFRYRDVTLLEFGTEYDQTLLAVSKGGGNAG